MLRPVASSVTRALSQAGAERALPHARADLDRLGEQLATGKRIVRPSDDPAGYTRARALGQVEQRLAAHERSLNAAALWTDRTQEELGALADLFAEANETAIRAANSSLLDAEDLALHIESIRDEVVSRLNARSGDEYLFAGNQTHTPPLAADGSVAPGDLSGERRREVAPGLSVALNVPGTDALFIDGVPVPERLQALADAIRSGDLEAVRAGVDASREGADHYTALGARSGRVTSRLRDARANVEAQAVATADARAAIEEIDLVEVFGAIQRRQAGLEAALRATAETAQQSLLEYL